MTIAEPFDRADSFENFARIMNFKLTFNSINGANSFPTFVIALSRLVKFRRRARGTSLSFIVIFLDYYFTI